VAASDDWRELGEYGGATQVLRAGHGLLMQAPATVIHRAADLLARLGAGPSVAGEWKEKRGQSGDLRVLLLGTAFVVASSFRFELVR
jgi:hypothetical protein